VENVTTSSSILRNEIAHSAAVFDRIEAQFRNQSILLAKEREDIENSNTLKKFISTLKKKYIITDDITSESVLSKYMGFCKYNNKTYRIDIRLVPLESYYTALIYFTGSYQLNTMMRLKAKKLGYKLNEYGLYKTKSDIPIMLNSEKDLFDILKIEYLEPQQRNIL
jgi:DNA polymerase/3'-5' exonuclease PolX